MTASADLRARVVLAELDALGLTIEDLLAVAATAPGAQHAGPTVSEYLPSVADSYTPRTRRTYGSYWRLTVELIGDKPLTAVTSDDLLGVADEATRRAAQRRPGSDGRASRESCIAALRAVFKRAHAAGLIAANPALLIEKPRRRDNRRRALTRSEVDDLWAAVTATSRDPDLDLLLVRFHLETGARRIGAINLKLGDVDLDRQTVWLREKFGDEREQPASASLLAAVVGLAARRGSTRPADPAFVTLHRRGVRSAPLSDRTYDRIFTRAQTVIPWAARTPVTAHVLRHTAVTAVERVAGFAVAARFAGHAHGSVTGTYTKADLSEVAGALAVLTGEPHPLATQ